MPFRNYYRCGECDCEWINTWCAHRQDDCPWCEARYTPPYKSEYVEEGDDD
jgi:hypothetical protein